MRLYARFTTASAALTFAGQLPGDQPITTLHCLRGGTGNAWWVRADLTLEAAREMVTVTGGQLHQRVDGHLLRDPGWGDRTGATTTARLPELRQVAVLDLVRAAGLHPYPERPAQDAALLLPGHLVAGTVRRALDLGLEVTYRPVALRPLFEPDGAGHAAYEVRLDATQRRPVPASLLAALDRNPFIMVCRRPDSSLLVRHGLASPLPDRALAALAADDTLVLADPGYGCARLHPLSDWQDGASLVRPSADHTLTDFPPDPGWAEPAAAPSTPNPPALTLARTRMRGVAVDAALLDDADLQCLPALLAGEPLAEIAVLLRGRNRHLLTAPGGLLENLPVGEALYCLGPGSLYLPHGWRTDPLLPARARRALFPTGTDTAIVLLPDSALRYNLTAEQPVWTLWAGELPPVDDQLPAPAVTELHALDRASTGGPAPASPRPRIAPVPADGRPARAGTAPPDWYDDAYTAERHGDYTTAAEIFLRHNDPLRAARLYERAAENS
jgi:hypothetical protein